MPTTNSIQRIARNSLIPIAAQFGNKVVDLVFMLFVFRVLGAEGIGQYDFAAYTWLLVKTASDFGLGTLAARDVARQPELAGSWLGGGTLLRLALLLASLPLLGLMLAAYVWHGGLPPAAVLATLLLALSIAPGAIADSATAIFNGRERMTVPALVTVLSTGLKVVVAGLLLWLGGGVVGLAAAAVIVNVLSAWALWRLVLPLAPVVVWWPGGRLARRWLLAAWPLLLNNLLATLFFRLDIYVLQVARGVEELGFYTATYRFINFALIVPPYLTMALFPGLARQAHNDRPGLRRTVRLAVGYLVMLALPAAVATTALADHLIWLLAGPQFLPGSAQALRILIWFLPLSYVNGLLQYVAIALDRQRNLTAIFGLTVVFNLGANILLVPSYGYLAAAAVTVASEVVLAAPLLLLLRHEFSWLDLLATTWRPVIATGVMIAVTLLGWPLGAIGATLLGSLAFFATLVALGGWGEEERRIARALRGAGGATPPA